MPPNLVRREYEMGVHRDRLNAGRAHKRFVTGVRAAVQRAGYTVPEPSKVSPLTVGAQPLSFVAPPTMEAAFGYRGSLRFVTFGYSPRTRKFVHCDGGDDIPGDSDTWLRFLRHPFIAPRLPESRYPTLYGVFKGKAHPSLPEIMQGEHHESPEPIHYLLADRENGRTYLCQRDHALLLFSLAEPDENDAPRVWIDRLRMSAGNENYKAPPAPELAEELFACLDEYLRGQS